MYDASVSSSRIKSSENSVQSQFNLKANAAAQPVVGEAVRNQTDIASAGHTIMQLFYSSPLTNLYLN